MFNSTFYLFYYYFLPFCVFRFQSTSDLNSAISFLLTSKPPWRNWLARSAVNRKVGGSSPPGGGPIFDKNNKVLLKILFISFPSRIINFVAPKNLF